MRAKYLEQDRLDISEAVKALSQFMAHPREGHMAELKRLIRYLRGQPRHVVRFVRQDQCGLTVETDSDWAGEATRRRSTSGMIIRRGKHLIRHTSTLQSVLALSSAEAEFYALTKGAAYALGVQSLFNDWGVQVDITMFTDSSSGLSFSSRRGLGKMRHIQTRFLWLQDLVASKALNVRKILGTLNPADILTKPLGADVLLRVCGELGQTPLCT